MAVQFVEVLIQQGNQRRLAAKQVDAGRVALGALVEECPGASDVVFSAAPGRERDFMQPVVG